MDHVLTPQILAKLKRIRWKSPSSIHSVHIGNRRSKNIGTSQEFSDYRAYEAGDDVRQIDWNVYARTEKVYIKRFLEERELTITVLLDSSLSMWAFSEKWKRSVQVASAIASLSFYTGDRVSVIPTNHSSKQLLSKKGIHQISKAIHLLQKLSIEEVEKIPFSQKIETSYLPPSDVTIVISDGLEPVSFIEQSLAKIQRQKTRVYYIQLLHEEELFPPYSGDLKLVDIETRSVSEVSMKNKVIEQYKKRLKDHTTELEEACLKKGILFIQIGTNLSIEEIIFQQLKQRGWVN